MGERLKERRRKINQKVSLKGVMLPEQRFFRFPQCCTKFETKESKASRNSKNDRKGRAGTINRERRKTMIAVFEVEVTATITHINSQEISQ